VRGVRRAAHAITHLNLELRVALHANLIHGCHVMRVVRSNENFAGGRGERRKEWGRVVGGEGEGKRTREMVALLTS
jgi:hypothetical protein